MSPKGIFLLGPNEWDDGYEPPAPVWLRDYLGTIPKVATPKHLRQALSHRISVESAGAWQGVVMSPENQRKGEDDAAFFERLEAEGDVQAYFILVPAQAKILGTIFEGGMLRRDFKWGANPRIVLFVEKGTVAFDEDGNATLTLKGKRTTYLKSLIKVAQHLEEWSTLEEAFDGMAKRARAEWEP